MKSSFNNNKLIRLGYQAPFTFFTVLTSSSNLMVIEVKNGQGISIVVLEEVRIRNFMNIDALPQSLSHLHKNTAVN